ncbi:glycosyltransferase [Verrucomicrobiaceae bacterium 5K15]|uniref:Glycosyltransferase n=1 Tax=Oceaniferula flava TaxID=2800421 RepID=A0AAE2SDY6_9BACT|nr:glycosyltransferase [Oceaniferula flavus]MBK1856516.1 glycosyltransferase [Oceaniferula flavus]MBM1137823.1 glycosyltransferase [Oceaniferula flavus]
MSSSSENQKTSVVLITNMIPPYRMPFFKGLGEKFKFLLAVDCVTEKGRNWKLDDPDLGFEYVVLNGASLNLKRKRDDVGYAEERPFHFSTKCFSLLKKHDPDVVVSCEFGLKTIWSILYCKLYGKKLLVWSEGTMHTEGKTTRMRKILRPLLVKAIDGFWTNGPESRALIESYGGKPESIQEGMTGVDTTWWLSEGQKLRAEREQIRAAIGAKGLTFVFNGSLSPRKGIKQLMDAFSNWEPDQECTIILLGSGELEEETKKWAAERKNYTVIMPGFLDPKELPRYLVASDWAILPTLDDNWPLATLEVLVCGLPQLFSVYNGATTDLCIDGVTGHAFDPMDPKSFVEAIDRAAKEGCREIPQSEIERLSQFYSPAKQTERAVESVQSLLSVR